MRIIKLTMEHVNKGTDMVNLPEHFKGTKNQCLIAMKYFKWIKTENLMGGYWVDNNGMDCYYLLP